jgi:ABC-type polysaccharide/polyol phosphate export permease
MSKLKSAVGDLASGAMRWRLWSAFAWEDLKTTYRRSFIGILWVSLSFAVFVGVKVLIFGPMVGRVDGPYFGAYLLLGFFSWQFISQVVTGAPSVFLKGENWLRNDPIELSVFVYQSVFRSLFDLALTGIIVVAVLAYLKVSIGPLALLSIPAILVYILNALWIKIFLGVLCTRFRDFAHLVQTGMRVMFFLTPIFWIPSQMPEALMRYLWWNPFAHFIWILRTPILDQDPAIPSWYFVGVVTVAGWTLALAAFTLFRRRIVFWF